MIEISSILDKLNEPSPFRSSAAFAKSGKDTLRFSISNGGSAKGFSASLVINDGRSGRYTEDNLDSFEEALDKLDNMYTSYIAYTNRFKGRELSESDMSDLLYT